MKEDSNKENEGRQKERRKEGQMEIERERETDGYQPDQGWGLPVVVCRAPRCIPAVSSRPCDWPWGCAKWSALLRTYGNVPVISQVSTEQEGMRLLWSLRFCDASLVLDIFENPYGAPRPTESPNPPATKKEIPKNPKTPIIPKSKRSFPKSKRSFPKSKC